MPDIEGKTLIAAWQRLEETLIAANKHYLMYADGGRAAVLRQLSGIIEFITTAQSRKLLHIPLVSLFMALQYLDRGIVEPMVAPNRSRRGRRPEQGAIKIRSAVAMSQLYDIGYSRKDAAKRVAGELTNLGFKATPGAVADWRDNFKSLPEKDEKGKVYRMMVVNENNFIGLDPKRGRVLDEKMRARLGRQILETLRKFVWLARLTSSPNLYKVRQRSGIGPT
jgi:hypothetical protein